MIKIIKFNSRSDDQALPSYRGRNGAAENRGVEVMKTQNNSVMLSPMNKHGVSVSCFIEIPMEHVPELINLLQFATRQQPTNVRERDTYNPDHV